METTFLEAMQGTYGNVLKTQAELQPLGDRYGLSAAALLAVLVAAQTGTGRCRTVRQNDGRWAVFIHPS